ncbi:MAG: MarR family transcriptional regulator [Rhizobium sp.]
MRTSTRRDAAIEEISNRIFFRLFQVANTMHTKGTKALTDLGVTTQQWIVLGELSRAQSDEGISVNKLSERLFVTRQNLSGMLDRLEREEIVERVTCDEDRRARRIRLTEKGKAIWASNSAIYGFYDDALKGLTFENRVELLHWLNQLQKNMTIL